MIDKFMAVLALATLTAFLAVVAVWVPDIDMIVVFVAVVILASYDFWQSLRANGKSRRGQSR